MSGHSSSSQTNVIVYGASGVLGGAVVKELTKRGARVAGTFHTNEAAAAELGRSVPGFVARRLDLSRAADIARVTNELATELGGHVDAIVHCATVPAASPVAEGDTPRFDRLETIDPELLAHMLAVNVSSPIFCVRAFASIAPMADIKQRNVVLVGSIDGVKPVPTAVPYATAKGALMAMARALAKELGAQKILVNVVAPGLMESGASRAVPEETKREYLKHTAMKRFGKPEEIAKSIAWLTLSNTYVTGQTLVVDGGL